MGPGGGCACPPHGETDVDDAPPLLSVADVHIGGSNFISNLGSTSEDVVVTRTRSSAPVSVAN
jgi:hypothetical protein